MKKIFSLITGSWLLIASLFASVNITKVSVLDSLGNSRTVFSSNEKISMRIETNCTSPVSRIYYRFYIYNPSGMQVFYHDGNSTEGNVGQGAATIRNIPVSSIYSSIGIYTFKGEVVVDGTVQDSRNITFSIYSPQITLTYPPNGVEDLVDRPVVFRWVSSGASRYRVYVDDERSFFNPIWQTDTTATSATYPLNPAEDRQKLSSGVVYYWKVEGYSSDGTLVAESPEPFSFSIKEEATSTSMRNAGFISIIYDISSTPPQDVKFILKVKNTGDQSISNLKVNLFVDGVLSANYIIPTLLAGQTQDVIIGTSGIFKEAVLVTGVLDISDDNVKDNILTKTVEIPLPPEYRNVPKILGRVVEKTTGMGIGGIVVKIKGPLSAEKITNPGGFYKFEKLPLGKYTVLVEDTNDYKGDFLEVDIRDKRAFRVEDLKIEAVISAEKQYSPEEIWQKIKKKIKDAEILKELERYRCVEASLFPSGNIDKTIDDIEDGKLKIKGLKLETVK